MNSIKERLRVLSGIKENHKREFSTTKKASTTNTFSYYKHKKPMGFNGLLNELKKEDILGNYINLQEKKQEDFKERLKRVYNLSLSKKDVKKHNILNENKDEIKNEELSAIGLSKDFLKTIVSRTNETNVSQLRNKKSRFINEDDDGDIPSNIGGDENNGDRKLEIKPFDTKDNDNEKEPTGAEEETTDNNNNKKDNEKDDEETFDDEDEKENKKKIDKKYDIKNIIKAINMLIDKYIDWEKDTNEKIDYLIKRLKRNIESDDISKNTLIEIAIILMSYDKIEDNDVREKIRKGFEKYIVNNEGLKDFIDNFSKKSKKENEPEENDEDEIENEPEEIESDEIENEPEPEEENDEGEE